MFIAGNLVSHSVLLLPSKQSFPCNCRKAKNFPLSQNQIIDKSSARSTKCHVLIHYCSVRLKPCICGCPEPVKVCVPERFADSLFIIFTGSSCSSHLPLALIAPPTPVAFNPLMPETSQRKQICESFSFIPNKTSPCSSKDLCLSAKMPQNPLRKTRIILLSDKSRYMQKKS